MSISMINDSLNHGINDGKKTSKNNLQATFVH